MVRSRNFDDGLGIETRALTLIQPVSLAGRHGRNGRPPFVPTAEQRHHVCLLLLAKVCVRLPTDGLSAVTGWEPCDTQPLSTAVAKTQARALCRQAE